MSRSERSQQLKPFLAMELLEKVHAAESEGRDVISLAIGEPDFDAPDCVKRAISEAIEQNLTKYTHSQGVLALREEISAFYHKRYGVAVSPERIVVTSGTSPALLLIFGSLLDPGDEVIIPDPHYACYPSFVTFLNCRPVHVPVRETDAFQYRPSEVAKRISKRTKAIMINSPANPTGTMMSAETMEEMVELGPYLVSDEIYHQLVYEGREHSVLEFTDRAFVLNGFSKAYAMTGFRLGYTIVPEGFARSLQVMQQNLFISANSFVQMAGLAALRQAGPDVERMREEFARRRQVMLAGIKRLGFGIAVEPVGAFYVFANAKKYTNDSLAFALDLFEKAGVAVTPGIDFGKGGEGYIRFSYANSLENIEKALQRIEEYLKNL